MSGEFKKLNINEFTELPRIESIGNKQVFVLPLKLSPQKGEFLHVGNTPSPLTMRKQAVFTVDGQPIIPASTFKGAFRSAVEELLSAAKTKKELAETLGISEANLMPCIPSSNPSKAEIAGFKEKYREQHRKKKVVTEGCWIEVDEERLAPPPLGLCPVCYLFGATGLEGYLRIPNFIAISGEWRIEQTRIRRDRIIKTAAIGAKVEGEQVKSGAVFKGDIWIYTKGHSDTPFGKCRNLGGVDVDKWIKNWGERTDLDDEKRQLYLISKILIPALNNIKFLGGQKSLGGGLVDISIDGM